jgi:hypothetical protein
VKSAGSRKQRRKNAHARCGSRRSRSRVPAARKKGTFPVFSSVTCFSAVRSTFSASAPAVVDAGAEPGAGAGAEL